MYNTCRPHWRATVRRAGMEARAGTSAATPASPTPLDLTSCCVVCYKYILYL